LLQQWLAVVWNIWRTACRQLLRPTKVWSPSPPLSLPACPQKTEDGNLKGPEFDQEVAAQQEMFGAPIGQPGQWASCLRLLHPQSLSTLCVQELDNNEGITSMALVQFAAGPDTSMLLAVGTAERLTYMPNDCAAGYIRIYRWGGGGGGGLADVWGQRMRGCGLRHIRRMNVHIAKAHVQQVPASMQVVGATRSSGRVQRHVGNCGKAVARQWQGSGKATLPLHPTSHPTHHPTPPHPCVLPLLPTACRLLDNCQKLELMHKTALDGIPGALAAFKGRLLAGVGPVLRLYELGKRKLLRKCEYRQLPHHVVTLRTMGPRIHVGDVQVGGGVGGRGGREQRG
jgi:hypothetical protein